MIIRSSLPPTGGSCERYVSALVSYLPFETDLLQYDFKFLEQLVSHSASKF
jgi:hypothetical protein